MQVWDLHVCPFINLLIYFITISNNNVLAILWLVPSSWVGLFILPFDRPTFLLPVEGNVGHPRKKDGSGIVSVVGKIILGC
jgi:hypothetical protein